MVQRECGHHLKCLGTYKGGEFTLDEFNSYCTQKGIKRQLTTSSTPQRNGVVERKNRTFLNMVRSILVDKELPKMMCG